MITHTIKQGQEHKKIEELSDIIKTAPEYLLTISASEYTTSKGKDLNNFLFKWVEGYYCGRIDNADLPDSVRHFVNDENEMYPSLECKSMIINQGKRLNAEVITNIYPHLYNGAFYMVGTALIPKK